MSNLPAKIEPRSLVPAREVQPRDSLFETLSAFESETVGVLERTSPKNERAVLHVLVAMLVIAAVLSAVVKLDRVVTGPGEIVSVGGPLYVSPLNTGIVRAVRVKTGDIVKKGQVLAELDPTLAGADLANIQQKFDSDEAEVERLTAEQNDAPYVPSKQNSFAALQMSNWQKRNAEYQSMLTTFDAQVLNATAVVNQYARDAEQYGKRKELADSRSGMFDPLAKKGYVSQLQLNALQDAGAEASRLHMQAQNQLAAARQMLAAAKSQRGTYVEKWHAEVGAQLVNAQNSLNTNREALEKAKKLLELGTLVAPADAIVLKIGKVSTGAVASSMSSDFTNPQLFTLAPLDAPLEAEIRVPAGQIGFIRVGDTVTLKLDAYSYVRHGTAEGQIKTISEGTFTTDENNNATRPYFKVRVAVTKTDLREVPKDFRLIPGMTVAGDVTVGKRTILTYLTEGALKTGSEAMREAQ
jgi:hemolysin D